MINEGVAYGQTLAGLKARSATPPDLCWDTVAPGFCAIATPAGKITFAVIRRLPGGKTPLTRRGGDYPIVTLAAGREWARVTLQDMIGGIDPKVREEAARKAETRRLANSFAAVAEDFIDRHVSKLRTGRKEAATIRRELIAAWGAKPVTDISRGDIIAAVERLADAGKLYAAHQLLAYTKKLFSWAIARGASGLENSPCDRISARSIGAGSHASAFLMTLRSARYGKRQAPSGSPFRPLSGSCSLPASGGPKSPICNGPSSISMLRYGPFPRRA